MDDLTDRDKRVFLFGLTQAFGVMRRTDDCERGVVALIRYLTSMYRVLGLTVDDPAVEKDFTEFLEVLNYHTAVIYPEWRDAQGRTAGQMFKKH